MKKFWNANIALILCFTLVVGPAQAPALGIGLMKGMAGNGLPSSSQPSATLMPDGNILLIGVDDAQGLSQATAVRNPQTGVTTPLAARLQHSRVGHTATLLPNGDVLVIGGVAQNGKLVQTAERFDTDAGRFEAMPAAQFTPRALHTATVLTDGRVLIAGGIGDKGGALGTAELWDYRTGVTIPTTSGLQAARSGHTAPMLSTGEVLLWGGNDRFGNEPAFGERFDAASQRFVMETSPVHKLANANPTVVEASLPQDGADEVPFNAVLSVRFSKPVQVQTVGTSTITLTNGSGTVAAKVIPAEAGMLAFVTPAQPLQADATYTLTLRDITDAAGQSLPTTTITFSTASSPDSDAIWAPGNTGTESDWYSNKPEPKAKALPPLQAPPGRTAFAGQILKLNGRPLPGIPVRIGDKSAETDETGRFLILDPPSGKSALYVNHDEHHGEHEMHKNHYCAFEINVVVQSGKTSVLGHTIWLPIEDLEHATPLPVPTTKEIVATHPRIPGLEVRIPAGVILRLPSGKPLRFLSITPMPLDRTPVPLPPEIRTPFFYVFQGHGAKVESVNGDPNAVIRIVNPNIENLPAGSLTDLWDYHAPGHGWTIYGKARVTRDRKQVVPEPGVGLKALACLPTWGLGAWFAAMWRKLANPFSGGDPVDLETGLFIYEKTDLVLPDTIPIVIKRTYRQNDSNPHSFGIGTMFSYDMSIVGDAATYGEVVLPDSARISFNRDTSLPAGVWAEHLATPSAFYKAKLLFAPNPFGMKLKDGTFFKLTVETVPLGYHSTKSWLDYIEDRYGNRLTVGHPVYNSPKIGRITSPNGRWVDVTSDSNNRISQITDNIGRTVNYVYDASGRLWKVIDPAGGVTEYGYDGSHRMTSIKDAKGITYLTNQYDANGRVYRQTSADGAVWQFNYTLDVGGKTLYTDVTDPRGSVRRVYFNTDGYGTTDTYALNQPEQQTINYTRQTGTNFVTRVTDPLNRNTDYTNDTAGNVLTVTRLAGTADAVTTTFTYEPAWNQVATVTDPLNHTTTFGYDTAGNLSSVTDPLNHGTTFTYDTKGRPLTAKDSLNNTTTFVYDAEQGDLRTITDPLNRTVTRYTDSAGRLVRVDDQMGKSNRTEYDLLNQVTKVVDPLAGETVFTHDLNGNLLTVKDARNNTTSYTYDNMDRLITRTDPLLRAESYQYDLNGNLAQHTDRRSKVTTYTYDKLDRSTFVGFGTIAGTPPTYESTISHTYDTAGRLTQTVDSVSGTFQHSYNNLDRLSSQITPQGTVNYTYDGAGRRATMTAGNQAQTTYTYDNADRLTGITQGTQSVAFTYDNANRRATLTLPNGIVVSYGYDNSSQPTGMTYTLGANTLGNLTYTYDTNGRRNSLGGTWARTNLPAALGSATYDAANQLTQWGTTTLTYDANGNMTNDGSNALTWNARNQLASMSGGTTASFQYDPLGRRTNKTIGGVSTGFLHDGINPVQEQLGGGVYANLLTGSVDEFFSRTDQLGTQTHLTDALGSTLGLANGSGTILTQYTYEPFGKSTSTGSTSTPFQFTGRENDTTGLFYYRARYYSSSLQRFISEDPIQFLGHDVNFYAYVNGDPLNSFDPLGLSRYVLIVGDPGLGGHNVGNSFNLAAETTADSLRAQGHDVIIQRASNVSQFNEALTQNGLVDGGVEYYGHSWTRTLYVGEQSGEGTNITAGNVGQLSNENLGPDATITLNGCMSGSDPAGSIAQEIANQLRRNVYAYPRSTFFGTGKCPKYTKPGDRAPNKKPVIICQQGGGGPKVFRPQP